MVQVRYSGVVTPKKAFEDLRPLWIEITDMKRRVRPLGSDYLILEALTKALDTAAYHFTREPNFYTTKQE